MSPFTKGTAEIGAGGFTLVELVGVMVIVAILALVALPRFFERQIFDARTFTDQSQSMLRYAQKLAVAQHRNVFVRLNGSSIALCFDSGCAAGNQVVPPAGSNSGSAATLAACGNSRAWFCEAPPSGIAYAFNPAIGLFYFDALGKPFNSNGTDLPQLQITVTGDGTNHAIFVEQETGYVHS